MYSNSKAARDVAPVVLGFITRPIVHQPTNSTLLQLPLDSVTNIRILGRFVGIYHYFGHILTAYAQNLLFPTLLSNVLHRN